MVNKAKISQRMSRVDQLCGKLERDESFAVGKVVPVKSFYRWHVTRAAVK